jgi:hypothetical protein
MGGHDIGYHYKGDEQEDQCGRSITLQGLIREHKKNFKR